MVFESIIKLPFNRGVNIALSAFGAIVAPYWFAFNFIPDIIKLELIPSLLVCVAISIPVILVYYCVFYTMNQIINKDELKEKPLDADEVFNLIAISAIVASFGFYIPCIVLYFATIGKSLAININIGINVTLILILIGVVCLTKGMFKNIDASKEETKR